MEIKELIKGLCSTVDYVRYDSDPSTELMLSRIVIHLMKIENEDRKCQNSLCTCQPENILRNIFNLNRSKLESILYPSQFEDISKIITEYATRNAPRPRLDMISSEEDDAIKIIKYLKQVKSMKEVEELFDENNLSLIHRVAKKLQVYKDSSSFKQLVYSIYIKVTE